MSRIPWRQRLFALTLVLSAAFLPGQATLTQLTTSMRQHIDAQISPDGAYVAYRVSNQSMGIVGFSTGIEALIYTSSNSTLTSYVWDPNSTVLYLVDGSTVKAINRSGSGTITLATIAGSTRALWTTSPSGLVLYGARTDGTGNASIFTMPANGGPATDIITAPGVIDEVRLDQSGRFLLYRLGSGLPFTPVQYYSQDLTGPNGTVLLYTSTGTDSVQSGYWLDTGQHIVFTTLSPHIAQLHLGRAAAGGPLEMLTDFAYFTRRSFVRPGSAWILCETLAPNVAGVSVAVMPVTGGGEVLLEGGRQLFLAGTNSGSLSGGLTMDTADNKIAVSAGTSASDPQPQIYVASLDREIRVTPRLQTGQSFRVDLPVNASELGGVAVSFGLTSGAPFTLPGVTGGLLLNTAPGQLASVVSGIGTGSGPLSGTWTIPANPGLVGFRLFFQGVRLDLNLNGAFTRWGHYVCF